MYLCARNESTLGVGVVSRPTYLDLCEVTWGGGGGGGGEQIRTEIPTSI